MSMNQESTTDIEALEETRSTRPSMTVGMERGRGAAATGVVYHDDNPRTWDVLVRSVSPLAEYFSKIGLLLVVDESEGMALFASMGRRGGDRR